jgi:hypothetical protein
MADADDDGSLEYWVNIMNMAHGYGAPFNHKTAEDKAIVELATCRQWCESITAEFGLTVGEPVHNPSDPPDCYVNIEGQRLGVELVQLVEPEHKRRASKGESPYGGQLFMDMLWSKERLESRLNGVLTKKATNYEKNGHTVDALIIHTAETWLNSTQAGEYLELIELQTHPNVLSAFLLFDYEPGGKSRHWPVFWLYGKLGDNAQK